jgi:ribosomal protein S24E
MDFYLQRKQPMSDELHIDKVSDKEIRIRLGANSKVSKATVTAEDLHEQLGKYLAHKNTKVTPKGCVIDYS